MGETGFPLPPRRFGPLADAMFMSHGQRTMGVVKVRDPEGNPHVLEGVEGYRLMELIRLHGLPIEAFCGGACACATCHVHVAPKWLGRLPGDIRIEREHSAFYFPIVTCIILSIVISLLLSLFSMFRR